MLRFIANCLILVLISLSAGAQGQLVSSVTPAGYPAAVITNFDGHGVAQANQISTYDVNGNTIDAFQGAIQQFPGSPDPNTFYRFGMGMGCGFRYLQVSTFCGFNVYSSTDLIRWTYRGQLFDPNQNNWQALCGDSCWEPHGAYNVSTGLYVFWFLNESFAPTPVNPSGYFVVTCPTPFGGCTEAGPPTISHPSHGDVSFFQDPADQSAYLVYVQNSVIYIEKLNAAYTDSTQTFGSISGGFEGLAMFTFSGNYYVTGSSTCPFCTGSTTVWYTASTPMGTYSTALAMSIGSCGGQQTGMIPWTVNGATTIMFQSELWNGNVNEGLANHYVGPVSFTGSTPNNIVCSPTITVSGLSALPFNPAPGADQTDEPSQFRNICDITGTNFRLQTFVPSHTATLSKLQMPIGQNNLNCPLSSGCTGAPDGNVTVSVVSLDGSNNPVSTLWSQTLTGSALSWTPQQQVFAPGISVTGGTHYGIEESATNTVGCFSSGYSENLAYPPGLERVSSNSGSTWSTDAGASLKFSVFLQ